MLPSISFEYPFVFFLLILFFVCAKFCKPKLASYYMPHLQIYEKSTPYNSSFVSFLKWAAIVLALIALASPIKELDTVHIKKDGISMVLSLDTSGSMGQYGFNPKNPEQNRWEVVQNIVADFIKKRENDNIGVVVFGTSVMIASPLSYDKKAQEGIIKNLKLGIAGEKTALIDSIATSINILKQHNAKSKIIILLTDGDDTASSIPLDVAIKLAQKYHIKIYTIGIGAINFYTLQQLSKETKGESFRVNSKDELQDVYQIIDNLEKSKIEQNRYIFKEYYFFYPLMFSFLFLLFFVYFKNKDTN